MELEALEGWAVDGERVGDDGGRIVRYDVGTRPEGPEEVREMRVQPPSTHGVSREV